MNYSGNKKFYHFEIYYLEYNLNKSAEEVKAAEVFYKNPSFYERIQDLENVTKNALQRLIHGLKNVDAKITDLFCPRFPDLEVNLINKTIYRIK